MSNELGDYGTNDLGTYFQAGSGPNQWLPNGASYITSPTLGNLLIVDEIFVEIEDCILDLDANLVSNAIAGQSSVSQAGGGSREFEITLYTAGGITDGLLLYTGEIVPTTILSRTQMIAEYGGVVITGKLSVRAFPLLETFEVYRDDVLINSGLFTVPLGNKRIDGTLFRVGAESEGNGNPPNTGGEHTAPVGWRIGNVSVSLDTGAGLTKVRELAMPIGTATNVPDLVGNNDGTLREGTGDGSDWGLVEYLTVSDVEILFEISELSLELDINNIEMFTEFDALNLAMNVNDVEMGAEFPAINLSLTVNDVELTTSIDSLSFLPVMDINDIDISTEIENLILSGTIFHETNMVVF